MSLKSHALHHISIITVLSCILDMCNWLCAGRIGLSRAHDAIYFACHMFLHFSCIRTPFQYNCYICSVLELFWLSLFLSLSFYLRQSCLWHLSVNRLRLGILFVPELLYLLILFLSLFGSVMMMPTRHFVDKAFCWHPILQPVFKLTWRVKG